MTNPHADLPLNVLRRLQALEHSTSTDPAIQGHINDTTNISHWNDQRLPETPMWRCCRLPFLNPQRKQMCLRESCAGAIWTKSDPLGRWRNATDYLLVIQSTGH